MVSLKMRYFSRMFDELVAWGLFFISCVLGLSVAPISQRAIPLAVFCRPFRASGCNGVSNRGLRSLHSLTPGYELSPFQGLQIHLCELEQ